MRAVYFDKNIPKVLITKLLRPLWPGVVWSPLSPTTVADLPRPPLPGPRWLRVQNRLCGICATDLALLFVKVDPAISIAAIPGQSRFNLGHEVVSEVVEIGPAVTRFRPGDRVVMETRFFGAWGAYGETPTSREGIARAAYTPEARAASTPDSRADEPILGLFPEPER